MKNYTSQVPVTAAQNTRLQQEKIRLYSELIKLIRIFILFPRASCTPERSFSVLTHVKSYLRSTMGQEQLNSCCLLATYKEESLNLVAIMKEFVQNENRLKNFGKIM